MELQPFPLDLVHTVDDVGHDHRRVLPGYPMLLVSIDGADILDQFLDELGAFRVYSFFVEH